MQCTVVLKQDNLCKWPFHDQTYISAEVEAQSLRQGKPCSLISPSRDNVVAKTYYMELLCEPEH